MKACIILNGEIENYEYTKNLIENEEYNYIICCDGGANHANIMKITPDYIIGDLDSIKKELVDYYKELDVQFKQFPTKKNETDTELAICLAKELDVKNIDIIGALGGRVDHTIANINLLYYIKSIGMNPKIISEKEEIHVATNEKIKISGKSGDTISIIPTNGNANGVTLESLEYPLNDYDMKFYLPLGISNVMLNDECYIEVKEGSLIIIRNI